MYIFILLILILYSCKTSDHKSSKPNILDGEAVPLRLEPNSIDNEEIIPSFLWSSSRRKLIASRYFLTAEYMMLKGKTAEALPLIETAYNLDPNPFLGEKLISYKAKNGDLEVAVNEARKMTLLYPKSANLNYLYGGLLAKTGFFKKGIKYLEQAIDLNPMVEDFYLSLFDIYKSLDKFPQATVVLKDLVKHIPHSQQGWAELAKIYLATSQNKLSLHAAKRAYDIQSNNPENILLYALSLELNGKSKKAILLYEKLYLLNPTNEGIIERMVGLYKSIGNLNQSLELLNSLASSTNTNKPAIQLQRAYILWELKKYKEASKVLLKLADTYPEHDKLIYMAGLGLEKIKNYDKALKMYLKIQKKSQFYFNAQIRIAVIYSETKKNEDAIKIIYSLRQNPNSTWQLYLIGASIFNDWQKYSEAAAFADQGFQKYPDKFHLLFLKGVYQEKAGDIPGCLKTMKQVIKLDPSNSGAYNYLGYILVERDEYASKPENVTEAERLIKKALKLKPGDGYYTDSLSWVYYRKKKFDKALNLLFKAIKIIPNEGIVYEHIGEVYIKKSMPKKAREYYKKALKLKLDEKSRNRIQEKLKLIKEKK